MNNFVNGLFLICVLTSTTNPSFSEEDVVALHAPNDGIKQVKSLANPVADGEMETAEGRSISDATGDNVPGLGKHSKPYRSIFMGIYKNYKSTYLGNKTLTEYKQTLRETIKNKQQQELEQHQHQQQDHENNQTQHDEVEEDNAVVTVYPEDEDLEEHLDLATTLAPDNQEFTKKLSQNRKRKTNQKNSKIPKENAANIETNEVQYHVGPALNLSLDIDNSVVKVNLDGESLKELVTGRWLNDNTDEGRGKKYDMVTKVLPLFILPFLIQSAIVPFLVTKLKLLLIKSMLVGKLAIFLLIISAFKNSNKMMQTYEVAPSHWAGEPSRRSELATAASNIAYNGYRVEGKPAAWIN